MNKIRVTTLFSGYDSQCMALDRLKESFPNQFDYELVAWSEIEPSAIKAHNLIYPQYASLNVGDITRADYASMPDCDLVTWSFPCQAISNAGKQEGLAKGSGTTSSLAWCALDYFRVKRPKVLLMENVKALLQKKFAKDFASIRAELEGMGYVNHYQVLNAKDYGVPQNRERVFMVSILKSENEPTPQYNFPFSFPLESNVIDHMEEDVDEQYYIDNRRITDDVLHNLLKQSNVKAEMYELYHLEEAFRRTFGRNPKSYKEITSHYDMLNELAQEIKCRS